MDTVVVESIPIIVGREEDGRWWADVESMPGVMAYGDTRDGAVAAVRALAFKWIRILYRCWQTGTRYDESIYLNALRKRGSPLLGSLALPPQNA